MSAPQTLISVEELAQVRAAWAGARVAFVPTMGALHEGHAALVRQARAAADRVIVSIFVNPKQFGPNEDFARYPRTLAADLAILAKEGADAVFVPNAGGIYPDGFQTFVRNKVMSQGLCGGSRPEHFEGVLTVVLKLFMLVRPTVAYFGKKDYQQWRLIAKMVEDLHVPVTVVGVDTVREADGLALSSRNRYLSPEERRAAAGLFKGLSRVRDLHKSGRKSVNELVGAWRGAVADIAAIAVEYVEVRRQADLAPFPGDLVDAPAVMLVAAKLGSTRLIDNIEFG